MNAVLSWFMGRLTAWGVSSLLGPLAPILSAVGTFCGAVISAVGEILVAMAKSYEGRIALFALAICGALLYGRYHYVEQGKERGITMARATTELQLASEFRRGVAAEKAALVPQIEAWRSRAEAAVTKTCEEGKPVRRSVNKARP
jgi:hypothetical protein